MWPEIAKKLKTLPRELVKILLDIAHALDGPHGECEYCRYRGPICYRTNKAGRSVPLCRGTHKGPG